MRHRKKKRIIKRKREEVKQMITDKKEKEIDQTKEKMKRNENFEQELDLKVVPVISSLLKHYEL